MRYGLQQRKIEAREINKVRSSTQGTTCGVEEVTVVTKTRGHYCIGERTGEQTRGTSSCTGELVVLELMEHLSHKETGDILRTGTRREQRRKKCGGNGGGGRRD